MPSGENEPGERGQSVARIAAIGAVVVAVVLVALVMFGLGSDSYTVKARFLSGGQLVKGNLVDIGGTQAGLVKSLKVTEDGNAEIELEIDEKYAPLRVGTRAMIRQGSLASPSNRYVQLMLPSEREAGRDIADGGVITEERTTTNVELDQFFSIFDRPTRKALSEFYKGNRNAYAGRGEAANRGLAYLSPQLAASTRLFEELRHEPPVLRRFLIDSERLVTALADRRDDLAALIGNLNATTRALGSEKAALAEVVERFPPFMRQANTTYVNLRGTLDELEPFVDASRPVARKLGPYLDDLKPFAREAVPTVRDLRVVLARGGARNDLRELNKTFPALADIAVTKKRRSIDFGVGAKDVGEGRGAFAELGESLKASAPIVAHGRPYTPDLFGWFDDFSHTGAYDALGSFSRVQTYINAFSVEAGIPTQLIPLADRTKFFRNQARLRQVKRCPGAAEARAEDGSNVFSADEQRELDCREADRATGDY